MKSIMVSDEVHERLKSQAKELNVTMKGLIEALAQMSDGQPRKWGQITWDLKELQAAKKSRRTSTTRMFAEVEAYLQSNPKAKDPEISEATGYSVLQVNCVTLTVHEKVLKYLKQHPRTNVETIQEKFGCSKRLARRLKRLHQRKIEPNPHELQLMEKLGV